jgi:hypothetical protein
MADTNTRSGSSAWDGRAQHGATGAGDVDGIPVDNDDTPVDGDGTPVNNDDTPVDGDGTPVNDDGTPVDDARVDAAASGAAAPESSTNETAGTATSADGTDLGLAQVRTRPVTETDPLLVHVGESIEEAKEAAREVFGEHRTGSEDEVDPNLGTNAPVP